MRHFTYKTAGIIAACNLATLWLNAETTGHSFSVPDPLDKVNLFLGTANDFGQLSPGATVPFGMIQVGPDCNPRQHPGYDYEVTTISGFSINRLSGVGGNGCGGNVSILPITNNKPVKLYKKTEKAVPGLYRVRLNNGVEVKTTADRHMAVEQFIFPTAEQACLLINPASSFEKVHNCSFRKCSQTSAEGMVISSNTCGRGRYHLFYKLFSNTPFNISNKKNGIKLMYFTGPHDNNIEIRIVVSTGLASELDKISEEDVWKYSFHRIAQLARNEWKETLSNVKVKGGTDDEQTIFYTSLYRTFHSPFQMTDNTFTHFLATDGKPHSANFQYYSSWSLWDTYRTKFPLITLMQPRRSSAIMQSLATLYITGKKDWSTDYECAPTVRTEHAIATLLDAYRQGVSIPNIQDAYRGMTEEVMRLPLKSPDQCLETAGDFWALGELAKELGIKKDAGKWRKRGEVIFDSIWPKHFMNIDDTFTKMKGNGLYQGTRWQYRWGAPMFLDRMIKNVGKKTLAKQLRTFFEQELYNQGNEPDIHVPFLFGRLGMPTLTGEIVRKLSREVATHRYGGNDAYPTPFVGCAFVNKTRGYCPEMDEDDGAMSAWYVFSAIGLYPTVVGEATYDLFAPLFDEICINTGNGKDIVIKTHGRTNKEQTLKYVTWNGKKVKYFRISHNTLKQGGELVFWF